MLYIKFENEVDMNKVMSMLEAVKSEETGESLYKSFSPVFFKYNPKSSQSEIGDNLSMISSESCSFYSQRESVLAPKVEKAIERSNIAIKKPKIKKKIKKSELISLNNFSEEEITQSNQNKIYKKTEEKRETDESVIIDDFSPDKNQNCIPVTSIAKLSVDPSEIQLDEDDSSSYSDDLKHVNKSGKIEEKRIERDEKKELELRRRKEEEENGIEKIESKPSIKEISQKPDLKNLESSFINKKKLIRPDLDFKNIKETKTNLKKKKKDSPLKNINKPGINSKEKKISSLIQNEKKINAWEDYSNNGSPEQNRNMKNDENDGWGDLEIKTPRGKLTDLNLEQEIKNDQNNWEDVDDLSVSPQGKKPKLCTNISQPIDLDDDWDDEL